MTRRQLTLKGSATSQLTLSHAKVMSPASYIRVELDKDVVSLVYQLVAAAERVVEVHKAPAQSDPEMNNTNVTVLNLILGRVGAAMAKALHSNIEDNEELLLDEGEEPDDFLLHPEDLTQEAKQEVQDLVQELEREKIREELKKACSSVIDYVDCFYGGEPSGGAAADIKPDVKRIKTENEGDTPGVGKTASNKRKRAEKLDSLMDEKLETVQNLQKKLRSFK